MVKRPVVVGLTVCREVIIDEDTHHKTLVNCVSEVYVEDFPADPRDYTVCCILADGLGEMDVTLEVTDLSTKEDVYQQAWTISLTDSLREQWLFITARNLIFPAPARYEFVLRINGEWFAHNTVTLLSKGAPHES